MKNIDWQKATFGNGNILVRDGNRLYNKYSSLPEQSAGNDNANITPNSMFKYGGCIYLMESNGELTFCNTWDASGRLTIPKEIIINGKNHPVTRIGHIEFCDYEYTDYHEDRRRKPEVTSGVVSVGAFFDSKVTECIFPSSIQEIEEIILGPSRNCNRDIINVIKALSECKLNEIGFTDDGQSELRSIGDKTFINVHLDMGTLKLPEGLRQIGEETFCGNFTGIICPSTLRKIGEYAFYNCSIKGMKLNDGLEFLGPNFVDLYHFTENLEIPSSIKLVPKLKWDMHERWQLVKKLPIVVIHNNKNEVEIDKFVKKTCVIHYIDASGKRKKTNWLRNIVYKKSGESIYDMDDLKDKYSKVIVIVTFFLFIVVLQVTLGILIATGVLH